MIISKAYRFPSELGFCGRFAEILVQEYGLVKGRYPEWLKRHESQQVLVWEDENKVGRYRVHLNTKDQVHNDRDYDIIIFSYWDRRITKDIAERDPMVKVLQRFFQELKNPEEIMHMSCDRGLEWVAKTAEWTIPLEKTE
jgi:hypothetical protein